MDTSAFTQVERQMLPGRVLIVTSVAGERDAVMRGLQNSDRFDCIIGGVGPMAAAASTARALALSTYDLVICAGIAGGFIGRVEVGSLVVAKELIAADLGAETEDGFLSVDELGFGSARILADSDRASLVLQLLQEAKLPVTSGTILTLSTVTGSEKTADELANRYPKAVAEAMEGFGVATAARDFGVPVLEIRSISNSIGPRDREAWRIKEAMTALETAGSVLREVL
ncbi:futalosine hydrolase [Brevibacillus daliensis]|uniref:futalosine hydrolase n=1 Tax=Brevibacillus daliensis TaxID=2892995 RepID=UPI001E3AF16E|nr:futalosine hydrolase [Brevibacillus daliensis]